MTGYALRRFLIAAPTLFIIISLSFFLMHVAPGGPFDGDAALEPEVIANLQAAYDLDKPIFVQYGLYLGKLAKGDFGPSIVYIDRTVSELLAIGLPVSLKLGLSAILIATLIGSSLGIIAALKQNSSADYAVMSVAMTGIAVPSFVMAPLMSLIFGVILKILPVAGVSTHATLPACIAMVRRRSRKHLSRVAPRTINRLSKNVHGLRLSGSCQAMPCPTNSADRNPKAPGCTLHSIRNRSKSRKGTGSAWADTTGDGE